VEEDMGALAISVENLVPVSRRVESGAAPERPPVFMWGHAAPDFSDTSVDNVKNRELRTHASQFVKNVK
jgi:hypothetical protein